MADGPLPVLDAMDQRILGSLIEKQRTVPASYPLSLNSLRLACNQTTSREPVVDYSEAELEARVRALKERGLVRVVWVGKGARTLKYHQLLKEVLGMPEAQLALVTVLLLRGAQSAGELRTRTERLQSFPDRDAVEAVLQGMAAAEPPLVRRLERRAGEKEHRWIHLLGPAPQSGSSEVTPAIDRESVLTQGPENRDARARIAWDVVADDYAEHTVDELDRVPFEAWLTGRIAGLADGFPVVDLGCGPGHLAGRIADDGADVIGMDPSPHMLEVAREWNPGLTFEPGGLDRLLRPKNAAAWGVVLAWYSLIHLAASELPDAFAIMTRTVRVGGYVVVALHAGAGVQHLEEFLGHEVDIEIVLHDPKEVRTAASASGLTVVEEYLRSPMAHETTERFYLLARRDI